MMLDVAQILASFALIMLIGAFVAWLNPLGRPQLRRLDGSAAAIIGNPRTAALLLLLAVGVSTVAAIMAIAQWSMT